ncbi:acyltransferase [Exiguobacterium chiriqhucha]|uniref:Acetyltransferase n=1 Tax=Exiguobacterium chiriqhucha RW-2 TaxID=1345023 RepID=U1LJP6_9BACL|nr:acyltransferase [Exiguobacterium chiriqhucha]ERG67718.1 hypothetical protein M467_10545 [Exiguobacterium chiriqhucha RW-2]
MILKKIKNYVFTKKNLKVGKGTRILTSINNFGSEPYLVTIGSNCTITSGVKFITHDASIGTVLNYKKINRIVGEEKYELMAKIEVGDNCMIGVNSIILPGVKIGPNSIVGAGSVVTKDVPPGTIVGGNPAKVISTLDEYFEKIDAKKILISNIKKYDERKDEIMSKVKDRA